MSADEGTPALDPVCECGHPASEHHPDYWHNTDQRSESGNVVQCDCQLSEGGVFRAYLAASAPAVPVAQVQATKAQVDARERLRAIELGIAGIVQALVADEISERKAVEMLTDRVASLRANLWRAFETLVREHFGSLMDFDEAYAAWKAAPDEDAGDEDESCRAAFYLQDALHDDGASDEHFRALAAPLPSLSAPAGVPVATEPVAWTDSAAVLAELELMTSAADTEEAAQCDKRWHSWAMRQASIIHGGNARQTVASAIAWARIIVGHAPPAGEPTPQPEKYHA